jgi:hypothetical protein
MALDSRTEFLQDSKLFGGYLAEGDTARRSFTLTGLLTDLRLDGLYLELGRPEEPSDAAILGQADPATLKHPPDHRVKLGGNFGGRVGHFRLNFEGVQDLSQERIRSSSLEHLLRETRFGGRFLRLSLEPARDTLIEVRLSGYSLRLRGLPADGELLGGDELLYGAIHLPLSGLEAGHESRTLLGASDWVRIDGSPKQVSTTLGLLNAGLLGESVPEWDAASRSDGRTSYPSAELAAKTGFKTRDPRTASKLEATFAGIPNPLGERALETARDVERVDLTRRDTGGAEINRTFRKLWRERKAAAAEAWIRRHRDWGSGARRQTGSGINDGFRHIETLEELKQRVEASRVDRSTLGSRDELGPGGEDSLRAATTSLRDELALSLRELKRLCGELLERTEELGLRDSRISILELFNELRGYDKLLGTEEGWDLILAGILTGRYASAFLEELATRVEEAWNLSPKLLGKLGLRHTAALRALARLFIFLREQELLIPESRRILQTQSSRVLSPQGPGKVGSITNEGVRRDAELRSKFGPFAAAQGSLDLSGGRFLAEAESGRLGPIAGLGDSYPETATGQTLHRPAREALPEVGVLEDLSRTLGPAKSSQRLHPAGSLSGIPGVDGPPARVAGEKIRSERVKKAFEAAVVLGTYLAASGEAAPLEGATGPATGGSLAGEAAGAELVDGAVTSEARRTPDGEGAATPDGVEGSGSDGAAS